MEKESSPDSRKDNEQVRLFLKQIVKKARAYEVRRLLRRGKQLQLKKGSDAQLAKNQRKAERIVSDVQKLRTFTADELTNIVYQAVTNARDRKESLEEYLASDHSSEFTKDRTVLSLMTSNLVYAQLSRLVSTDAISKYVLPKTLLPRSPRVVRTRLPDAVEKEKRYRKSSVEVVDTSTKRASLSNDKLPSDQNISIKDEDKDSGSEEASVFEQDDFFLCNSDDDPLLVKRPKVNSPESKQSQRARRIGDATPSNIDKSRGLQSTFLGSMSVEMHNQDRRKEASNLKKNRMGQRSRQKLWSVKYGESAKHRKSTSGVKYKKIKRVENIKKSPRKSGSPEKFGGLANVERGKAFENLGFEAHPSWEAKRKQKASQQIQVFKGTKITFDDD